MLDEEEEELSLILDASKDLPDEQLYSEKLDTVLTEYNITSFPTGTLIVSRGTNLIILYHSNDMNTHASILVWYSHDGTDKISLGYEHGKSRPLIFELDTYLHGRSFVQLVEHGVIVREEECAYRPRPELLSHPRYLHTIDLLVHTLPLSYLSNDIKYGFLHKWQPNYWKEAETYGFENVKKYYNELASSENPLADALRQRRVVAATCVDVIMTFISLLHEDLYINLTAQELSEGLVRAEKKILESAHDYDVSRLLRPTSEIYKLYETAPLPFLRGIHTHLDLLDLQVFFMPLIMASAIFMLILLFIRPISSLLLDMSSRKGIIQILMSGSS